MSADTRLAAYGTLAPGRKHADQLAGLSGRWIAGHVRGHLTVIPSGPAHGYPGLTLDTLADPVPVQLFQSPDLPDHWGRLDRFEGPAYLRVIAEVITDQGRLSAFLYALRA
ncbi:gamma-glutamylcyclotransferase family protein [Aestuariivita boseongensis]|uniref:gamma-glutamylcyclotransferase family protein n=1 Tax=Aestuariivita boseongensis TaxID=1470562 RepID=UPI0006818AF0|nr:gamma-glutamylcyclotransferase family protein [Aestuariivita boseongensis]